MANSGSPNTNNKGDTSNADSAIRADDMAIAFNMEKGDSDTDDNMYFDKDRGIANDASASTVHPTMLTLPQKKLL